MIAENTKEGLLQRAEAGLYNSSMATGFGYMYSSDQSTIVPHPEEAPIVREIFDWFTDKKWGKFKIARVLNMRGVPTKRRGESSQWTIDRIAYIIRNPAYAGMIRLKSGKQNDSGDAPEAPRLIEAKFEAIIPREQFEAAQDLIKQRQDLAPRAHGSIHLLSGIATCARCGRNLRAHYQTKKNKYGSVYHYVSYRHERSAHLKGAGSCIGVGKSAIPFETAVVDYIAEASQSGVLQKLAVEDVSSRQQDGSKPMQEERDNLTAELADIADKFTQRADRLDSGSIDEDQFGLQNRRLLKRKQDLQKRITEREERLTERESIDVTCPKVKHALSEFPRVWDVLEIEEKREMLRLLIEYLKVDSDTIMIKLAFLPETELQMARAKYTHHEHEIHSME